MEEKDFRVVSFDQLMNFWKLLIPFLVGAGLFIYNFADITNAVRKTLAYFIVEAGQQDGVELKAGYHTISLAAALIFTGVVLTTAYLSFVLISFVATAKTIRVRSQSEYKKKDDELAAKQALIVKLDKRLDDQVSEMKKLLSQLYPDYQPTKQNFSFLSGSYYVAPGGDLRVEKQVVLKAVDEPVHFWRFYIEGDERTKPAEDFADIVFKAKSIDAGTDVVVFPIEDTARKKNVVIWFLPQIEPHTERRIKIEYQWPGFLYGLDEKGKTEFFWNYQARDTQSRGHFQMRFIFSENYGEIEARSTGAAAASLSLKRELDANRSCWVFGGEDVFLGNTKYELRFQRV
jgi:multisubunit Na+/H+ antiporter MnhC subunit